MPGTAMLRRPPLASLLLLIDASAELCAESFATMVEPFVAVGVALPAVNLSVQAIQAVNKYVSRRDRAEDIKTQLRRIKLCNDDLNVLKPHMLQHLVSHSVVNRLKFRRLIQNAEESIQNVNNWESKILDATPVNRVTRMEQILNQCEQDLKQLLDFCDEKSTTEPGQDIYRRINTVPVNPPRLLLEYNDPCTCEGQLKAAVLKEEKRRVVWIVASGKGGVGKTCAIRGLAADAEINDRFAGGILYIQLGNDATINDILRGLASIVDSTGGKKLSEKVKNCKTLQEACSEAADWFSDVACLFLIDDIWHTNGINKQVLTILASMVNSKSRLVYTSRDKHFLSLAHDVITFEGTEPDSEQSRKMLLLHGGFSEIGELDEKNRTAFERILVKCKGLPLAFGIAGGTVHGLRKRQERGREQDAWSDVCEMVLDPGQSILLRENAELYGGLMTRMVDISLQVLENEYRNGKYKTMFRALCVLQKQQRAPVAMLQKLWGLSDLEETERAAEILDEISVLQLRMHNGVLCVQLHDLVLDIAREQARDATASFYRTLLRNYAPNGEDWWNIEKDGYLHDNLCRLMRCAGSGRDVLQLLSEPKWVVHRLLDGGINKFEQDLEEGKQCLLGGGNDSEHQEFLEMVGRAARLGCTYYERNEREIYFQLYGRLLSHATQNEETREFLERLENRAPRPWVKASMGLLQQAGSSALELILSAGEVLDVQYREDAISFIWISESKMGVLHYSTAIGSSEYVEYAIDSVGEIQGATFLQNESLIVSAHQNRDEKVPRIVRWSEEARKMERKVQLKDNREITVPVRRHWCDMWSDCFRRRDSEKPQHDEVPQCGWLEVVGFCKQGTLLATANCSNHAIQMWDTESGAAVGTCLRGHTGWVKCVDVSADGTRIVSGSLDETVRMWDAESGAAVGEPLRGHTGLVSCVAVSADGTRIVSGSHDKTVRVWDAGSGAAVGGPLRGHTGEVMCVGVSADGTRIVSGSLDSTVRIWDAESGGVVGKPLCGHSNEVTCISVSANGTHIVSGSLDKTVRMWGAKSFVPERDLVVGHTDWVRCVDVTSDGNRIVSGSDDMTLRLWDAASGAVEGEPLRGHTDWVRCVVVSADGSRIVSGSDDMTVRVWSVESGAAVGEPLRGHTDWVTCLDVSADGRRIVSGSKDKTVRLWDLCRGKFEASLLHHGEIEDVALSADGSLVMTITGGKRMLWDARSGECLRTSDDLGWKSTVQDLNFSLKPQLRQWTRRLTARRSDGTESVLATCETRVRHVDGTDVFWGEKNPLCVIIR